MMMICAMLLSAGSCLPPQSNGALFSDVSQRPPDAKPETIDAIAQDRRFAEWVVYQDRMCDTHGCAQ